MDRAAPDSGFLTPARLQRFEALQRALVPRSASFTEPQRSESRALVDRFLSQQPERTRRKLALFLIVIDVLSIVRGLRPFRRLTPRSQQGLLQWLFDSPIGLLRKGFWGLNTLARLGVYGQPGLHSEIGYRVRENRDA